MIEARTLPVEASVEAASLLVLLVDLLTVRAEPITSLGGPAHGTAHLVVIAMTFTAVTGVPGIGGMLVLRWLGRTPEAPGTPTASGAGDAWGAPVAGGEATGRNRRAGHRFPCPSSPRPSVPRCHSSEGSRHPHGPGGGRPGGRSAIVPRAGGRAGPTHALSPPTDVHRGADLRGRSARPPARSNTTVEASRDGQGR